MKHSTTMGYLNILGSVEIKNIHFSPIELPKVKLCKCGVIHRHAIGILCSKGHFWFNCAKCNTCLVVLRTLPAKERYKRILDGNWDKKAA